MAAAAASPPPASQPTGFARWVPNLPTITLNHLNPFAGEDPVKQAEGGGNAKASTDTKRPFLSTLSFTSSSPPSPVPSNVEDDMFAEPDTRSTSEADSREGSIAGGERKKKSNRPKTRFSICHPPPASLTRQKLHRRPRSLLQLHRITANARPRPAFEVVPSANFSVRLTRAITKIYKAKHSLCPNDIVVLRAEKYSTEAEDEDGEVRDVIGLICKGRKDDSAFNGGKAKVCMASGHEWEAYPLMNGGYEFFSTDEHGLGLTVRWVPKRRKDGSKSKNKQFNFSTISPNSRRHPIIANLSKTGLEINDSYRMPEPAATTPLSTPKATPKVSSDSAMQEAVDDEDSDPEQYETDDALREIITMTGIWVTFKEGWSPSFKYEERDSVSASAANNIARSASLGISNSPSRASASPLSTPPGSPSQQTLEKRNSMRSISSSMFRRSSNKASRASQISTSQESEQGRSESLKKMETGRARGDSTSTVLINRATSNRRKHNDRHQTTWRPDLLDAQHPLSETSREHLSRTPSPLPQDQSRSTSIWDAPPETATHQRRESVARPLIPASGASTPARSASPTPPPAAGTGSGGRSKSAAAAQDAAPRSGFRPGVAGDAAMEKRESTTTTDTNHSDVGAMKKKANKNSKGTQEGGNKKKGGWRKLWCGSGGE
ncbi:hypothetical protein D0867_07419 [Hortaea werneckii]|uniref:Uncharacterized protein n=1 Tax=Hortaea werneckii TaxID=91943 RepID=A0A3M6ZEM8_HORWE|nr:hypothetical protein KC324_g8854 [Hortaea werneckii]RMX98327.1 hypothetical protein D0868_10148 [Hortaea werneckii]RMY13549.1 hypothetical protein D0867_07419 [Hortaea werneckii]RMY33653.1 hypothetical protein D0866_05777 [Hortaea werneckii]